jgi:hypothetical protein
MAPATACPGCGLDGEGREALCGACWTDVPGKHRTAVRNAQKALGYNPASARAQKTLQLAIADAVGAMR